MQFQKVSNLIGLTALVGALFATSVYAAMTYFGTIHTSRPVPVTLSYRQLELGADGNVIIDSQRVFALNSDGSIVRARQYVAEDGSAREIRSVIDAIRGEKTVIASATKSTTTFHFSSEEAAALRSGQRHSCPLDEGSPKDISGYEAFPHVRTSDHPEGGLIRGVTYYSPELGCVPLEASLSLVRPDGTEVTLQSTELLSVAVGEPDATLFDVPAAYVELSPAEYKRQMDVLDGVETPELDEMPIYQTLQTAYDERRASDEFR